MKHCETRLSLYARREAAEDEWFKYKYAEDVKSAEGKAAYRKVQRLLIAIHDHVLKHGCNHGT
jgi:hypothetical protein